VETGYLSSGVDSSRSLVSIRNSFELNLEPHHPVIEPVSAWCREQNFMLQRRSRECCLFASSDRLHGGCGKSPHSGAISARRTNGVCALKLDGGGCSPVKPVSAMNFPFITEFNRENLYFEAHGRKAEIKLAYTSASCGAIP
jgi:hypothetical protein